jgi:hypothetical protein
VAVTGIERGSDGVAGLVGRRLEDPETKRGQLDAVVEGERLHVVLLAVGRRAGGGQVGRRQRRFDGAVGRFGRVAGCSPL